ncbi:hypothetical protein ASPFODRAFT_591132 [Aspergillus luchuensis CBS 106.47]|uniref:Uncharacterized protein n=1 Tax=Aspergillus luchuensis (strain CBS 106.47) TaxID=1137211 RepID=A0A1M3TM97_ASPLC|nr:hypothetical protein ASPFODRAFT_591132 [Aspergillus luchuensis CBS 106.47]
MDAMAFQISTLRLQERAVDTDGYPCRMERLAACHRKATRQVQPSTGGGGTTLAIYPDRHTSTSAGRSASWNGRVLHVSGRGFIVPRRDRSAVRHKNKLQSRVHSSSRILPAVVGQLTDTKQAMTWSGHGGSSVTKLSIRLVSN